MKKFYTTALFLTLLACGDPTAPNSSELDAISETSSDLTVSTEAGLTYKVRKSSGDIISINWKGKELQSSSKGSHLSSGLGSAKVSRSTSPSGATTVITIENDCLTHYLVSRRGENNIYMATYASAEPDIGELRWITRLRSAHFNKVPEHSRIQNGTAIESKDIFQVGPYSYSKYYGNQQARDLSIRGVEGPGVGVYMVYGNRESSSGGPFFRDIQNQSGSDIEVYNYMNSGHNQTEDWRVNVLHGPYVLMFTDGPQPALPDTSWMEALNLKGWVQSRGYVVGKAIGTEAGIPVTVGFHNETAQYWCKAGVDGNFSSPAMKPGDYIQTLYQGELAVATRNVTVLPSQTTKGQNITSSFASPATLWRLGFWDGSPEEFRNGKNFAFMHPSDPRNAPWTQGSYAIGQPWDGFPAAQWMAINNNLRISFKLNADQITNHQLRLGVTAAIAGGRPLIKVNGWTSRLPPASSQPQSRSLTIGSYRGRNRLYTYDIPASAFVVGDNNLELVINSGSSGAGFLSPGVSYDAIELVK